MKLPELPALARVWLFRIRAACWAAIGAWSFAADKAESVTLVWAASLYANIATDLGGAAAADDRRVLDALAELAAEQKAIRAQLADLAALIRPEGGDPSS